MKLHLIVLFGICFTPGSLLASEYAIAHARDSALAELRADSDPDSDRAFKAYCWANTRLGCAVNFAAKGAGYLDAANLIAADTPDTPLTDRAAAARARVVCTVANLAACSGFAIDFAAIPNVDHAKAFTAAARAADPAVSLAANRLAADINKAVLASHAGGSVVFISQIDAAFAAYRLAAARIAVKNPVVADSNANPEDDEAEDGDDFVFIAPEAAYSYGVEGDLCFDVDSIEVE